MPIDSIPARLLERQVQHGALPAYHHRRDEVWHTVTWARFASEVHTAARSLVHLGLAPGQATCLLCSNRPEWVIFAHATMMAGGTPAGIYTTSSPHEVQYIIDHAGARLLLLEDPRRLEDLRPRRGPALRLDRVVLLEGADTIDDPLISSWERFLALAEQTPRSAIDARMEALQSDDVATLIYTSGTTGDPKAVMLTHHNLAWTATTAAAQLDTGPGDRSVSFLPLPNIAEQMFTVHVPATVGAQIFYAAPATPLPETLRQVQPTLFFAVPRIWEKLHARVSTQLDEATGVRAALVAWAMGVSRAVTDLHSQGKRPTASLWLRHQLAQLLSSRIRAQLGLSRVRICVTGAAPIAREILEFFAGLDLTIHEVYGQSEDCGATASNLPGATRPGTVGRPLPGTEVRLADDGEILVRGPHVFRGYLHDEAATSRTLVDGWLHTGDLGAFDRAGFLSVTGRRKEIIVTAGGKNIAPKHIEAALRNLPLISQAVVIGDRRRFLSALLTLDPEAARAFAAERGRSGNNLHDALVIQQAIERGVDEEVNPLFARVEHICRWTILPRDFSIEAGELTPTLKIKRRVIYEHFNHEIEEMYADV